MLRFRRFTHFHAGFSTGSAPFEHWYRDNAIYFITARARDRRPVFSSDEAKTIFWDRFDHWTGRYAFIPLITSLIDNHYHTLGYLPVGANLGPMMQRIHGSVAKLVNDTLQERHLPFWREAGRRDYFDGCIRDEVQFQRAYRYVLRQSVRHGLCGDWRLYAHTRIRVELDRALEGAKELKAFMKGVPYKRYQH
jgi:hypothetical protein